MSTHLNKSDHVLPPRNLHAEPIAYVEADQIPPVVHQLFSQTTADLINVKHAMEVLKIKNPSTLIKKINQGYIREFNLDGYRLISRSDCENELVRMEGEPRRAGPLIRDTRPICAQCNRLMFSCSERVRLYVKRMEMKNRPHNSQRGQLFKVQAWECRQSDGGCGIVIINGVREQVGSIWKDGGRLFVQKLKDIVEAGKRLVTIQVPNDWK